MPATLADEKNHFKNYSRKIEKGDCGDKERKLEKEECNKIRVGCNASVLYLRLQDSVIFFMAQSGTVPKNLQIR